MPSDDIADFSATFFNPNLGAIGPDKILRIPMGGTGRDGVWDGYLTLAPDHEDYTFWVWMLKKWPYKSSLDADDIPQLKAEFRSATAT